MRVTKCFTRAEIKVGEIGERTERGDGAGDGCGAEVERRSLVSVIDFSGAGTNCSPNLDETPEIGACPAKATPK